MDVLEEFCDSCAICRRAFTVAKMIDDIKGQVRVKRIYDLRLRRLNFEYETGNFE